jgi:predicted DNA-binding transcriptional regulator YafY
MEEKLGEDQSVPAKWGQEKRMEFIEFRLQWEGRVNRQDLVKYFAISVPQASLDFARYRELAPLNAVYDVVQKAYLRGPAFKPALISASADSYLTPLWAANARTTELTASFLGWTPSVAIVRDPARRVDSRVLQEVLLAVREGRTVQIEYQSMSSLQGSTRLISPHAFGFDGSRWHVRAFCHKHEDFRDFLLGRVRSAVKQEASKVTGGTDEVWNTFIEAVLEPNPALTESQKQAVEDDYCMTNGKLILRVREALLFYHLQHLGLLSEERASMYLHLANREALASFFAKHTIRA